MGGGVVSPLENDIWSPETRTSSFPQLRAARAVVQPAEALGPALRAQLFPGGHLRDEGRKSLPHNGEGWAQVGHPHQYTRARATNIKYQHNYILCVNGCEGFETDVGRGRGGGTPRGGGRLRRRPRGGGAGGGARRTRGGGTAPGRRACAAASGVSAPGWGRRRGPGRGSVVVPPRCGEAPGGGGQGWMGPGASRRGPRRVCLLAACGGIETRLQTCAHT